MATQEDVWHAITLPEHYCAWTKVFASSSHFVGNWNKGDSIRFLATNAKGKLDGMVAEIAEANFPSFLSIRHLGYVYDGVDDTTSDEIKSWAPAYENYTLTKVSDQETLFELEQDVTDDYYEMFLGLWPKAMVALKDIAERISSQPIYPCLWFNQNGKDAADFYCSLFNAAKILDENGFVVTFELMGSKFMAINGGPMYKVNSAVSYTVYCESDTEIERIYSALVDGGQVLMPLGSYNWSQKYAWVIDQFGVNWQLDVAQINHKQKIVPTLLFTNAKNHLVREAVSFYTDIIKNSELLIEAPYPNEAGMPAGSLLFAQVKLGQTIINAMSSTMEHDYDFTPGNSIVIECGNQNEIDYYWEQLGEGGHHNRCGWLVDKFGVSWQIIPKILSSLVADPIKGPKVIQAFMQMNKFDIEKLISV